MPLNQDDIRHALRGLADAGFRLTQRPPRWGSPLLLQWRVGQEALRYRVWLFEVGHGGNTRSEDEFRIQVSGGPKTKRDEGGWRDLLLGYDTGRDLVVAYDARYLSHFLKQHQAGKRPSPSAQVSRQTLDAAAERGIARETKGTEIVGPDTPVVALRPQLLPALLQHPEQLLTGEITLDEALQSMPMPKPTFSAYAASRKLFFPYEFVARYVAALGSKPLVIFSGVSGTGKTKLAQLVAEYFALSEAEGPPTPVAGSPQGESAQVPEGEWAEYAGAATTGAEVDRSRFAFVSVRPDWLDNRGLLGSYNPLTEKYEATDTLVLLLRAARAAEEARDAEKPPPPYFLILDEMNLARVEHYFSDFLSCLETRRVRADGFLEQEPLALHERGTLTISVAGADGKVGTLELPGRLAIPENVYITGTVNVDETTFGFSPKVLDRAHVLEFDTVDLEGFRTGQPAIQAAHPPVDVLALAAFELPNQSHYRELDDEVHRHLRTINGILERTRFHFGYRTAAEIALFMKRYGGVLSGTTAQVAQKALDAAILQKVLPRLTGNRARLEQPLETLVRYLVYGANEQASESDATELDPAKALFPASARRTIDMIRTLREYGFVSFFR